MWSWTAHNLPFLSPFPNLNQDQCPLPPTLPQGQDENTLSKGCGWSVTVAWGTGDQSSLREVQG